MKALALVLFVIFASACGASLVGTATKASGPCGGHLDCGHGDCCIEAPFDSEDWQCGGVYISCPAGTCCYVGSGAPGETFAARAPVKLVKAAP